MSLTAALVLALAPLQEGPPGLPPSVERSWWLRRAVAEPWVLFDVHVVDPVAGEVSEPVNIVVQGDRIVAVDDRLPSVDADVIDGAGAYVLPGLFDLHAHVVPPSPMFPDGPPAAEVLRALVEHGVTTIRLLPLLSEDAHRWRAAVNAGELVGPTIVPSSGVFEQVPQRTSAGFGDPATAAAWVRKEALLGARWIKVYNALDEASLAAIVGAAREHGLEVCGHAHGVRPWEAVALGQRTLEHVVDFPASCLVEDAAPLVGGVVRRTALAWRDYDPERGGALIEHMKAHGAAWVPTLVVTQRILESGSHDGSVEDPADLALFDAALTRAAREAVRMHRAGGRVGLGTDFPVDGVRPGVSVHEELALLVERGGATAAEALAIATVSSARILGLEELLGTVAPGKLAHFLVLEENPLEDVRHAAAIRFVVHDGRVHRAD